MRSVSAASSAALRAGPTTSTMSSASKEVELRLAQPALLPEDEQSLLCYHAGEPDGNFPYLQPPPELDLHADSGFFFFNSLDIPVLVVVSMLKPVYCLKVGPGETKYLDSQKTVFDVRVQAWAEGSEESILNNPQPFGMPNIMTRSVEQSPGSAVAGSVALGVVTALAHVHPIVLLLRAAFLIKRKHLQITDDFIVDAFANGRTVQITGKEKDGKVFRLKAKLLESKSKGGHGKEEEQQQEGKDKDA